jgi:hypothetical protein
MKAKSFTLIMGANGTQWTFDNTLPYEEECRQIMADMKRVFDEEFPRLKGFWGAYATMEDGSEMPVVLG